MDADRKALRRQLKEAGLSDPLIDAAWPSWWSDEAFASESARAELRFTIARKLGLSPSALFHNDVEFAWKDEARFKHLSNETDSEKFALTSFGISIGNILVQSVNKESPTSAITSLHLRESILANRQFVDLQSLLASCWAIGIPVIHLRVFPLEAKRMHAMAVQIAGRHAILLGRDAQYPAPAAFTLAHELGHIMCGHLAHSAAIVDVGDPLEERGEDVGETQADQYAIELLLGRSEVKYETSIANFTAPQLAQAALKDGPRLRIEPGTLALTLAYAKGIWPVANAALKFIYDQQKPVWHEVNRVATQELDLSAVNDDAIDYLNRIMGVYHG